MRGKSCLVACAAAALVGGVLAAGALADGAERSPGAVVYLPDFTPVDGAGASIVRNDNGVHVVVHTHDLTPGDAHSIWIHILEPDGDEFLFNVGGGASNGRGQFRFAANVSTGTIPPADGERVLIGDGEFDDPHNAEFGFIMRSHGQVIPGMQWEQFHTVNGGCNQGEPNEGQCEDRQAAVFF